MTEEQREAGKNLMVEGYMQQDKDKRYYNMYTRVRDGYGDKRGMVDLLDFPVIQKKEKQEYAVFLDILEEKLRGHEIVALQQYMGASSPIGEPLYEMRSAKLKQVSAVEDFINPIDEPAKGLSYKYQPEHVYFYKEDDNLSLIRVSSNKFEPEMVVKETFYDITNLPIEGRKVLSSSVGRDYLDLECVSNVKSTLNKEEYQLGYLGSLYINKIRTPIRYGDVLDRSLPEEYVNGASKLDAVLASTSKSTPEQVDRGKSVFADACKGGVTVYAEIEYWHRVKEAMPSGVKKEYLVNVGVEASVTKYDNMFGSSRLIGANNKDVSYGMKAGDLAVRISGEVKAKAKFDNIEITAETVTVMRILPKNRAEKTNELKILSEFYMASRKMQGFRTLSGVSSWEEWQTQAKAANAYLGATEASVLLLREKTDEMFPLKGERMASYVLEQFARQQKTVVDSRLGNWVSTAKLRESNLEEIRPTKEKSQRLTDKPFGQELIDNSR